MSELCIRVRSRVSSVTVRSHKVTITGQPERVMVAVEQGPRGKQGDPGPAGPPGIDGEFLGTAWHYGEGMPDVVVGAKAGDYYMDTTTGLVYELK